jgi:hypothetical protein
MPAEFTNDQLVACARRELAMRKSVYLKRDNALEVAELSPKLKGEYDMMQAIVAQLAALPELLARYQSVKDVLRDILPQPVTFDSPKEGTLVLVYCTSSERPYLATRTGLNQWRFEDNNDDMVMDGLDSKTVFAFSYPCAIPKQ